MPDAAPAAAETHPVQQLMAPVTWHWQWLLCLLWEAERAAAVQAVRAAVSRAGQDAAAVLMPVPCHTVPGCVLRC